LTDAPRVVAFAEEDACLVSFNTDIEVVSFSTTLVAIIGDDYSRIGIEVVSFTGDDSSITGLKFVSLVGHASYYIDTDEFSSNSLSDVFDRDDTCGISELAPSSIGSFDIDGERLGVVFSGSIARQDKFLL
ncbi:hypothetical protein PanWU01x14_076250, partial [Parasponia andersonii]